jgi:hypothetical protein
MCPDYMATCLHHVLCFFHCYAIIPKIRGLTNHSLLLPMVLWVDSVLLSGDSASCGPAGFRDLPGRTVSFNS